jgi:hypothetical protein
MVPLAVSIINNSERTLEITDLTLNNCAASMNTLTAGTPIGEHKTVADLFGAAGVGAWGGSITVRNYLTSQNYLFTFSVDGELIGFNAEPFEDGPLKIDVATRQENDDHYIMFSID